MSQGYARSAFALAALCAACTGDVVDDTGAPTPFVPEVPAPKPDPWRVDGQVGDLTLIRQEANVSAGRVVRVAGVFADRLDGLEWPAACEFSERLCVPAGTPLETEVDALAAGLDTEGVQFAWLGDEVVLDDLIATFDVKPDGPLGGYRGRVSGEGLLLDRYPLVLSGGEWGDFDAEALVPLPERIQTFYPPTDRPVALEGETLTRFRWAPGGEGQMVLTLRGASWATTRLLEDDGEVLIDTAGWRWSSPVDVRLSRVAEAGVVDVNGNALTLHTIAEQGWCLYDTCAGEPIGGITGALDFEFCWSPTSCGDSRWVLHPDGTWTTLEGYIGTWEYDCCNERIDLYFSSGTHYWGERDETGCFVGEMLSWSGNQGDWQGCL
ncbi:MAG: hypothetical protein H6737_01380 [Alphaproteobacteria bacterium]|nr:hypothetical protein [Alphaproteobacteria bacterium]